MTTLADTSDRATRINFIQRHPLFSFFILAIGLTWVFMITDALGSHGILPFRLPVPVLIMMGYMPTLAAVIVAGMSQGKNGIKALFRKLLIARVGLNWYAFAIFGCAMVSVMAIALYNTFGSGPDLPIISENAPQGPVWQLALMIVPMFILIGIVNGEELAWRGFALPRLQSRYNALTSSVMIGVIWTLFHLPLFFTKTGSSQADMSLLSFMIATIGMSVLYTWMYNNTRGSVLLAYLLHAAANTWTVVFSLDHSNRFVDWVFTGLIVLAAVIVVIFAGAENLSRVTGRIQE